MNIKKIDNSPQALAHLRKELSEGEALAKLVLLKIDFTLGEFLAEVPNNIDQSQLDFRWSNPTLSGGQMTFVKVIKSFVSDPNCAVIIEDPDAFPVEEDSLHGTRAANYKDETYWIVSGSDLSESDIFDVVDQPFPHPSSVFLSIVGTWKLKRQLNDSDLEHVVDTLVGVAVRAFDGDSFLIWWRKGLYPFPPVT
jgi:hypothetical protein